MAYFPSTQKNKNDPQAFEEKKKKGAEGNGLYSSATLSNSITNPGPLGNGTPKSQQSNWANLQDYLAASGDRGTRMGQALTGAASKGVADTTKAINQSAQEFNENSRQNAPVFNPDSSDPTFIGDTRGRVRGAPVQPVAQGMTAAEARERAQSAANYQGYKDVTQAPSWANTVATANDAQKKVDALKTEGGRAQTLRDQYGSSGEQYAGGEVDLDAFLGAYGGHDQVQELVAGKDQNARVDDYAASTVVEGDKARADARAVADAWEQLAQTISNRPAPVPPGRAVADEKTKNYEERDQAWNKAEQNNRTDTGTRVMDPESVWGMFYSTQYPDYQAWVDAGMPGY